MATTTSYTKAGLDAKVAPLANTAPLAPGTANAGTSGSASRADHIHPAHPTFPGYPLPSSATGLWATPVGRYTGAAINSTIDAPVTPLPVYRAMTLVSLVVAVRTAADAGTFSVALYATDATGVPTGAPLWVSADEAATSQSAGVTFSPDLALEAGLYMLAFGGKGFSSTRPLPANPNGNIGEGFMPTLILTAFTSGVAGACIGNYNATTGEWPSAPTLGTPGGSNSSIFWYAIQADPVA